MAATTESRLLPVCVDGKYGYINERGEIVAPCRFDYASPFSEGLATICYCAQFQDDGRREFSIIDIQLHELGRLTCSDCGKFSEGRMSFEIDWMSGFVDPELEVRIPPSFDIAREFVNGVATVKTDDKWGAIDRAGQWLIQPEYQYLWSFNPGERVTGFSRDGKVWGLLDREGNTAVEPRFSYISGTVRGCTPAAVDIGNENGAKYGVINEYGEWTLPPTFDNCDYQFAGDTLGAAINARWGIVDRHGAWIVEPRFTFAEAFHDGLSRVYVGGNYANMSYRGGKCGYVGFDGEFVIGPTFDDAWPFEGGVARVALGEDDSQETGNRRLGYIDKHGHYIWKPTR